MCVGKRLKSKVPLRQPTAFSRSEYSVGFCVAPVIIYAVLMSIFTIRSSRPSVEAAAAVVVSNMQHRSAAAVKGDMRVDLSRVSHVVHARPVNKEREREREI